MWIYYMNIPLKYDLSVRQKIIGAKFINYDGYIMVDAVIRNNEIITFYNKVRKSRKKSNSKIR